MQQLSATERDLVGRFNADAMLSQVQAWSAVNTGTRNLDGLARQWDLLAEAFSDLPGEIRKVEPARVTAIAADGREEEVGHGAHFVLSVRPQAARRYLLTGHMDTVFPATHAFQQQRWLDDETLNGPGVADMKGGIAVILAALAAFETSVAAAGVGYDVMINSDEETGSLASAALIAELARGKAAALTYEPSALPDGTLAGARGQRQLFADRHRPLRPRRAQSAGRAQRDRRGRRSRLAAQAHGNGHAFGQSRADRRRLGQQRGARSRGAALQHSPARDDRCRSLRRGAARPDRRDRARA
jgi:glutamate carboxypeptidase